jgi:hypothetical protein
VRALALLLLLLSATARADTWVTLDVPVPDEDVWRAVACAAPLDGDCRETMAWWPAPMRQALPVAFRRMDDGPLTPRAAELSQALDHAIAEINAVGADIRLVRAAEGAITFWDSTFVLGEPIILPAEEMTGWSTMEGARVEIWWGDDQWIDRGVIVVAADLDAADFRSVALEELVQSLGLLTDLEGAPYALSSIFSETSNAVTRLAGQDAAVLRLHYPPE